MIGQGAGISLTTGSKNTFLGGGDQGTNFPAGYYVTTGSSNTILGCFSGNAGGLDIRTANNYIVLSDGDGNPLVSTADNQTVALEGAVPNSGTGITFPATQSASSNANTLDDYEEGTFTPTLNSFTIVSQTSNTGAYTKIGRQVFLNIIVQATSIAATAGSSNITNLPFAPGLGNFSLVTLANANTIAATNSGGVVNNGGSGVLYPPATTGNDYMVISAMYWV
jgi:hypothetical protein